MGHPASRAGTQQFLHPLLHQLADERIRMHGIPDIVPITPHVLGQSDGHRRGARPALLAQALMGQHKVVEVDDQPDPRAVSALDSQNRSGYAGARGRTGRAGCHTNAP